MSYLILDVETDILCDLSKKIFKATPFYHKNHIVVGAYKYHDESIKFFNNEIAEKLNMSIYGNEITCIVGANIAFDLSYICKATPQFEKALDKVRIWDVLIAEYILTGQEFRGKGHGLDALSVKYGGDLKDDRIKTEYWDKGINTSDIPNHILHPYLKGDIENTELVFLQQYVRAEKSGQLPLILEMMESRLATWSMQYHGIQIDSVRIDDYEESIRDELIPLRSRLDDFIRDHLPDFYPDNASIDSNKQLSLVLFGGTFKYKEAKPVLTEDGEEIRYKSGKKKGEIKTRLTEAREEVRGLIDPVGYTEEGAHGIYSVDGDVLEKIKEEPLNDIICEILEYRELEKTLSTYIEPFQLFSFDGGLIHPDFNHNQTITGRLSSSKPNFQNITGKDKD